MRSITEIANGLQDKVRARQAENAFSLEANATNAQSGKVLDATETPVHRRGAPKVPRGLMPVHHPNRDFFLCDLFDYALKDDGVSMEAPIFSLSTKPDLNVWHWESKDGSRTITVTPSVLGRATQFDKDLLIYVVSQMTEALNRERMDAQSRTVRFRVYDYLVSTNKPTGGREYQRLQEALERLRGTSIKTNIQTGGQRVKEGFGIVDAWKIIEKSPDDERMIAVEISLSNWLFNAVQAHEVLTINPDYFRLRKPIERRIYEIARKHCGDQARFVIGVELLKNKCGSQSNIREFRRILRELIQADSLPDYRMQMDNEKDQVVFYTRDSKKLALALAKKPI
ncbi:replication initiator protein A [Polaromonas sp. CG_9.11]|uniref:replication initiator protein A n=1 Tax=Polaromonas sp. CG_9.11 TaxID=2787730 RepID=UPI0018CAC600|nr:replication initiator protein A [Polaromonas sp. CG_9.11]MBG6077798.1 plasmid replication initiation protein [Polaromonas sp. CG_9.11]